MVQISELDVDDDAALRAFWEVAQAAERADRSHPVLRHLADERPERALVQGFRPVELSHEMQRRDTG